MPSSAGKIDLIDSKAVKSLVEARAVHGATILGQPGGWAVVVRYGAMERAIAGQKSRRARLWRHPDTAIGFVRAELGLDRFEIDAADHDANAVERRRPDTAERQRQVRTAAARDAWFRTEVEQALKEADDPATPWTSNEDMQAEWEEERAELLKRIAAQDPGT